MTIITNIGRLLTLEGARKKGGRNPAPEDLSILENAAMVVGGTGKKTKILWVGSAKEIPAAFKKGKKINAQGRTVMPGFIDSHTHLVFAGDRSQEFEMRLAGKSYQEISKAGGGIVNTMSATRKASQKDLLSKSEERILNFLNQGVTTIEIKTGYGLDFESELKCLKVIEALKKISRATICSTFLGAHAVPPEFKGNKDGYVNEISYKWLPKLKKYCDFVDMFIDEGFFDKEDGKVFFNEAQKHGLKIKIHADELKLSGGTETAIKYSALSADHLLMVSKNEISALKNSEVTATLLPTTAFFLDLPYAPARQLLDSGVRVALASDFNPGTSPTQDISIVGLLSALKMGMSMEEIIVGLTLNGAFALGLENKKGALLPGYDADFIMFDSISPMGLFYEFGQRPQNLRVFTSGSFL